MVRKSCRCFFPPSECECTCTSTRTCAFEVLLRRLQCAALDLVRTPTHRSRIKKPRKSAIPCEWDCPLVFPVVCVCAETSRVPSPRSFLFFPHVKAGSSSPFSLNLRQARSVLPPPPLKQWELKEPPGRRSIPVTWTPSTYPPRKRSSRCVPTTPRSRVSSRRFYVCRVFFGRDPPSPHFWCAEEYKTSI